MRARFLAGVFFSDFPTFISSCGFGFMRTSAPIRRLVASKFGLLDMTQKLTLDPNPFLKPVYSETGDADSPSLARIKGYALSQWEHAETGLMTTFSILIRPTGGSRVSDSAFGSIFSSGSRRELVLGAAEAYFALLTHNASDEIKASAFALHKKLSKHISMFGDAARRRDEIAHGVVMGTHWDGRKFFYFRH